MQHWLIALSLLWPLGVVAQDVQLVTGDDYAPFTGKDLPQGGLATEIVTRVFATLGEPVLVDFKPWKRGYQETLEQDYLATFPYEKNPERAEVFAYSQPLYRLTQHFFAQADSPWTFEQDEDLAGARVCVPIGYNPVRVQELVDKELVVMDRPVDITACFEMLARGRTDLVRIYESIGWSVIENQFGARNGFRMLPKPLRESLEHLIIARDHPEADRWISRFDEALQTLEEQGVINEIINHHLQ